MIKTKKSKLSILVIEDEALLLQAISKKLKLSNIEVLTATTGKQALSYLKDLGTIPDAIWLDYYLPDTNGMELVTKFKKNKKWSKIPIIVVSNSANDKKVHAMLGLGVDKYLVKAEYTLDKIIKIIKEFVIKESYFFKEFICQAKY